MLELTYSNRTEALLERLAERASAERAAGRGPWEPIHLVVPNPYLKDYLRQGLARRLGVAANIRFSYLDGLWKELLAGDGGLLASDLLRAGLLAVFEDRALLAGAELAPVRDYLGPDGSCLKRVQLATELARLFEEYQLSRPDWIDAWRAGKRVSSDPLEAWQSRLWRAALAALDGAGGAAHVTLLERVRASRFEGMKLPGAIHAFGLSHVAQAYREVFTAFVPLPDTTLHIYDLNPCGEFWEDLDTRREALWTARPAREEARLGPWDEASDDFYQLAAQGPRALRLWGRPGREKIRLLNEVSDCDFTSAFELPAQPTLLGRMQRDILLYREPSDQDPSGPDGSIRCLACPSLRREAEVVATEIWRLLETAAASGSPLSFSDIAVVVPPGQQEAYLAHLQAACHDAQRIPLVLGDQTLPVMGQTLEAAGLLLDLPGSGLTRSAVLRVLEHPGPRRRFDDLDTGAWSRWCEEFGIVRGADRAAWDGTYLDQDALNWDQGLKRLSLGAFMTEGEEFRQDGQAYRVNGARDPGPAAAFIAMVRGLCADARELLAARLEPRAWARRLTAYLERWLLTDSGEDAEAVIRSLDRVRGYMERAFERVPGQLELPRIDFAAARHLALEALARLKGEQPANLAKGVVVASYATMRAIPFRAIFLMGNGEGSFPTRNQRSALDLRSKGRRPGDVSQTEKEKYLFLEMLLSARDHLVLSYVALDELSGERFEPSGLFQEFRALLGAYLGPGWAPSDGTDPFLETHPLRRYDPAYFPAWFGLPGAPDGPRSYSAIAAAEARALCLGGQARRHGLTLPLAVGDLEPADGPLREALGALAVPAAAADREVLRLSLSELRTFLECPLSGAAAVRLGLRKRELEDRAAMENELFESDFLDSWSLQREVAVGCLRAGEEAPAVYDRCVRSRQAEGGAPFGVFAEVEKERNLETIQAWVGYLRSPDGGGAPVSWRLGGDRARTGQADVALPPLAFAVEAGGRTLRVELTGDLRLQLGGSLFLETGQPPAAAGRAGLRRKALAGYLDHLVLACVDPGHGEHRARFVFERAKGTPPSQEERFTFPAMDRAAAEAQLGAWLRDLLGGRHDVLLPIEAALLHWEKRDLTPEAILAYVDGQLEQGADARFSTLNGPVPDPVRFDPPAEPQALVEARLGGFLRCVFEEQA